MIALDLTQWIICLNYLMILYICICIYLKLLDQSYNSSPKFGHTKVVGWSTITFLELCLPTAFGKPRDWKWSGLRIRASVAAECLSPEPPWWLCALPCSAKLIKFKIQPWCDVTRFGRFFISLLRFECCKASTAEGIGGMLSSVGAGALGRTYCWTCTCHNCHVVHKERK